MKDPTDAKPAIKSDAEPPGPQTHAKLLGLALAGGKSTRMGYDKRFIRPWGETGPTLLEHTASLLALLADDWILADAGCSGAENGIPDKIPGAGPAAGLISALEHAADNGFQDVLALACDLPNMTLEPLKFLQACHSRRPKGSIASFFHTSRPEMLAAIYSISALPVILPAFNRGERALFRLVPPDLRNLAPVNTNWLPCFLNCNRPDDLDKIIPRSQPIFRCP